MNEIRINAIYRDDLTGSTEKCSFIMDIMPLNDEYLEVMVKDWAERNAGHSSIEILNYWVEQDENIK
jgi:hypothetical protein